jgi:probable phosphoglycerate mutase
MQFYFVRHGTTLINQEAKFNGGGVDSALTDAGRQGAVALGDYLSDISFQSCFSSPLPRALRTAELVLARNTGPTPPIQQCESLREIDLGDWDGTVIETHRGTAGFDDYFARPDRFNAASNHGEDFPHLISRGKAAILSIFQRSEADDRILVVSHGVLLTTVMNSLLGVALKDVRSTGTIDNASVTILSTDDGTHFHDLAWNVTPGKDQTPD